MTADEHAGVFVDRGALSDFSAKIQVAYLMGLFGKTTKQNLGSIRAIRNAFAHIAAAASFDAKPIADLCGTLKAHKHWEHSEPAPKIAFTLTAMYYAAELWNRRSNTPTGLP